MSDTQSQLSEGMSALHAYNLPGILHRLKNTNPDILVMCFYTSSLTCSCLSSAKLGWQYPLLEQYRGQGAVLVLGE